MDKIDKIRSNTHKIGSLITKSSVLDSKKIMPSDLEYKKHNTNSSFNSNGIGINRIKQKLSLKVKIPLDAKNLSSSNRTSREGSVTITPIKKNSNNNLNYNNPNIPGADSESNLQKITKDLLENQIILDELESNNIQPTPENIFNILKSYCSSNHNTKGSGEGTAGIINLFTAGNSANATKSFSHNDTSFFNFDEKKFNDFLEHKRNRKNNDKCPTPQSEFSQSDIYSPEKMKYSSSISPMFSGLTPNNTGFGGSNLVFFNNNYNNFVTPNNVNAGSKKNTKDSFRYNPDLIEEDIDMKLSNAYPMNNSQSNISNNNANTNNLNNSITSNFSNNNLNSNTNKTNSLSNTAINPLNANTFNSFNIPYSSPTKPVTIISPTAKKLEGVTINQAQQVQPKEEDLSNTNPTVANAPNDQNYLTSQNSSLPTTFYSFQLPNNTFPFTNSLTPPPFWNLNYPNFDQSSLNNLGNPFNLVHLRGSPDKERDTSSVNSNKSFVGTTIMELIQISSKANNINNTNGSSNSNNSGNSNISRPFDINNVNK